MQFSTLKLLPRAIAPASGRGHPRGMSSLPESPRPAISGTVLRPVERWRRGARSLLDDHVAEEVPVAFVYNDEPFAVMMATRTSVLRL